MAPIAKAIHIPVSDISAAMGPVRGKSFASPVAEGQSPLISSVVGDALKNARG